MPKSPLIANPLKDTDFKKSVIGVLKEESTPSSYSEENLKKYARPIILFIYQGTDPLAELEKNSKTLNAKLYGFLAEYLYRRFKHLYEPQNGHSKVSQEREFQDRHSQAAKFILKQLELQDAATPKDAYVKQAKARILYLLNAAELFKGLRRVSYDESGRSSSLSSRSNSSPTLADDVPTPSLMETSGLYYSTSPTIEITTSAPNTPAVSPRAKTPLDVGFKPISRQSSFAEAIEAKVASLDQNIPLHCELEEFKQHLDQIKTNPNLRADLAEYVSSFKFRREFFNSFGDEGFLSYVNAVLILTATAPEHLRKQFMAIAQKLIVNNREDTITTAVNTCAKLIQQDDTLIDTLPVLVKFLAAKGISFQAKQEILKTIQESNASIRLKFGRLVSDEMMFENIDPKVLYAICNIDLCLSNDLQHMSEQHNAFIRSYSKKGTTSKPFTPELLANISRHVNSPEDVAARLLLACTNFYAADDDSEKSEYELTSHKPLSEAEVRQIIDYQTRLRRQAEKPIVFTRSRSITASAASDLKSEFPNRTLRKIASSPEVGPVKAALR